MIHSVLLAVAILLLCINLFTPIWRQASRWRTSQPTPRDTQDALSSRLDCLILHTCRVEERLQIIGLTLVEALVELERTRLLPLPPTPPPPPTPTSEDGDSDSSSSVLPNGSVDLRDGPDWSDSSENFWDDADDFLFN